MIVVHGVRTVKDLAYGDIITKVPARADEFIGEYVADQLVYYPTVTREPFRNQGRITALMENGKLFARHRPAADEQGQTTASCCAAARR